MTRAASGIANFNNLLENDADLYQQQVSYGLQRVKLFSWEATAHSLLHIYREIAMKEYR